MTATSPEQEKPTSAGGPLPEAPTHAVRIALILSLVWAVLYGLGYRIAHVSGVLFGAALVVLIVLGAVTKFRWVSAQRPRALQSVLLGLLVGGLTAALTWALLPALMETAPGLAAEVQDVRAHAGATWAWLPAIAVIALAEEVLWREVLQSALVRRFSAPVAIVIAALVYALAQAPVRAWSVIALAFGFGILWGVMRYRSGALWASIVAHMIWTLSQVVMPLVTS